MKYVKIAIFILFVSFIVVDYAPGQSSAKELESEKIETLIERIKTLEESISKLRSEIASLEKHFKNIQVRPPLSSYRLPREMTLCGERVPLQDRNIWENLDREFIVSLDNHAGPLMDEAGTTLLPRYREDTKGDEPP